MFWPGISPIRQAVRPCAGRRLAAGREPSPGDGRPVHAGQPNSPLLTSPVAPSTPNPPPPPHEVGEEKEMSVDRIAPLARGAPLPTSRR
ncbi:hypothetical protein S40293_10958 [Stachybotrys chartarum IBT 40293]|nr:hypothetical protein S40293_10958 [Stachybotrys chartarum IBT 40293]